MDPQHLQSLLGFLSLGCSGLPVAALPSQDPEVEHVRPIRQGDDEAHAYPVPILPGREYDPGLSAPDDLLGRPWGSRLASHDELLAALRSWAEASPRATIETYGRTYEGRPLVRMVITTKENHARLASILADHERLFDPRGLSEREGTEIAMRVPAVAWMGYSIHGDETSGADAAPLVAYHLIACRDSEVSELLEDVVVVLDPCLNPDGRERMRAMVQWNSGYRSNLDHESLQRGRWPFGRGNHYLFDMNRDWMAGVCPETRGRWSVLREYHPQLFVDAHEMGALDTFLFYPQSKPQNPELPATLIEWQSRFADDAGEAFDAHGWGYYTREWADAWYPGYSDAWGSLTGAIGMLYEQAGGGGQPLERASGEVVSYRESVHHQFTASLANLRTLGANRVAVLRDYVAHRRGNVDPEREWAGRAFAFLDTNPARTERFLRILLAQGIEVLRTEAEVEVSDVVTTLGERLESETLPAGAYLVPALQPQGSLVRAYLGFDPRIDDETVEDERGRLERGEGSRLYDVTAWDLGRQFDLDGRWCTVGAGARSQVSDVPERAGALVGGDVERPYAWAVDAGDDRSLRFAARALELGLAVHASDEEFAVRVLDGRAERRIELPRGSLILRRHENPEDVDALVQRVAAEAGARVWATPTGRGTEDDPDLGGGHFHLLARPRVALVSGNPVSASDFGHIWHMLDVELGMQVSLLEARGIGGYDLRRYNVIVIPPARGIGALLEPVAEDIAAWVRGGGTLVACGSAAAGLTGEELGLTSVVLRRDALDELDAYAASARRANRARTIEVDHADLWGEEPPAQELPRQETGEETGEETPGQETEAGGAAGAPSAEAGAGDSDADDEEPARRDAWQRRFMPAGVILRGIVDQHSWLTAGVRADELPVPFGGSSVLLSHGSVPVRLASGDRLRLGGLLWPEARERLADSAWLTREGMGHGQVVLFAAPPAYRGSYLGTARMLGNAVVLGPGLGADPPVGR